jgi:predicted dehydrogenase
MSTAYSPLRWGILGAGNIAAKFTQDTQTLADHKIVAVGSRETAKSEAFGAKFAIPNCHASYEALATDPDVDVIYVATPHNFHKEHCLLALNAGKHVLCEKPFTLNLDEANDVIATAAAKNLFLMEGMWSRCFPAWVKVRQLVREGAIGKPRMMTTDFGFKGGNTGEDGKLEGINPEGRLYNLNLAGGALMDVGVYTVSLAQLILGDPIKATGLATVGNTGVDENTGMLLQFANGEIAALSTSLQINTTHTATILGTGGKIEVHAPCWVPRAITVYKNGEAPETIDFPFEHGGFQFEAAHVAECLRAGKIQSDISSWSDTQAVMRALDAIRHSVGVQYPGE